MTTFGFVLLLMGAGLVVAEAHVPGGVLGVLGGIALMLGGIVVIAALGAGAALAVPIGVGLGAAAAGWTVVVRRAMVGTRHRRIAAGREALCGRVGVVRGWSAAAGQVFLEGALWHARLQSVEDAWQLSETPREDVAPRAGDPLHPGDRVVVERVSGLTLCVRPADPWELFT